MRTSAPATQRLLILPVVAVLALLAACGGSSGSTADPAPAAGTGTAEASAADPGASSAASSGSTDAGSADLDTDDVCTNLDEATVASALGVDSVKGTEIPTGCMWRGPGGANVVAAIIPYAGSTDAAGCQARSAEFFEVEQTTLGGHPAFSGVQEEGTEDMTVIVCLSGSYLTIDAHLPRTSLEGLAEQFVS